MHRRRSRSRSPIRRDQQQQQRRPREKRPIDPHSDRMVYLSNLPFELKWNELKDLIRQKVGETAYVEFMEDRDNKPKGCAILDFDSRASAKNCVDVMHRMEVGGRSITASEIRDPMAFFRHIKNKEGIDFLANRNVVPGRAAHQPRRERIEENGGGPYENETYGLSPTFLGQLNIKPPLCNRVFVTNIPYNCGVGKLYDIFALAGRITWFDLQLDAEGKTKGMAIIQFSHPIEAVQAISMLNNQRLLDRTLSVKMDRFEKDAERAPGELPVGLRAIGMGLGANGAPLADVASVLSSLASVNNSAVAAMGLAAAASAIPQIQQQQQGFAPMNGNNNNSFGTTNNPQGFPPAEILQNPTAVGALNGSFGNANPMGMIGGGVGGGGGIEGPLGPYNSLPPQQQLQQQQVPQSNYSSTPNNNNPGFFNATQQQQQLPPVNNGPPMNSSGFNPNGNNMYSSSNNNNKMSSSPQINNYGGSGGQQQQHSSSQKGYYDNQPSRIILIKNLPMDYTWQIVQDRVQKFGDVENVEIISPGVAKVRYLRVPDAERTKATLSGTTVEGRIIAVEYL